MSRCTLIEASAGTGKTQALAEHLIALVRDKEVAPQDIVALTFSRAAAGEIFERFVSLLVKGAEAGESRCAKMLRQVIATQHLSQIGTLDSFLMRIVRCFPLELGLEGRVEIMDDYRAKREAARTSFSILRRTDAATQKAFVDAFSCAMNGEDVRSFVASYRDFVADWQPLVRSYPSSGAWGDVRAIWGGAVPAWVATREADLDRLAHALEGLCESSAWPDFIAWVRNFKGSLSEMKGFAKKFFELDDFTSDGTLEVKYNRRNYVFTGTAARAVRNALLGVCGYVIRRKLETARGIHGLITAYEAEYNATVRTKGRLVFDDVPRLLARLPEHLRLALEYRLDCNVRAWALDEFQDTSRDQWRVLGELIDEAKPPDSEKSIFLVGDTKQAIYGWRNGDVSIFRREKESGVYTVLPKNETYRSSEPVVDAINRIFVYGRLRAEFPDWEAEKHVSAKKEMPGFVQAVVAADKSRESFLPCVYNALAAVDPVGRGLSAAVLVRKNDMGEAVAAYLKSRGMDGVVWEGESSVLGTPALQGFLDLVQLADHPGCKQAYLHFASTPLAAAMYPNGLPPPETAMAEVSQRAAQLFTEKGLVRTFRELRALLPEEPSQAWSEFTEGCFTDMLHAAAEFELSIDPGTRLSDFADFLAAKKKRNLAEPGKIKIMTIHRSKGLGFNYVVLPLYESESLDDSGRADALVADGWVMPDPGAKVAKKVPELAKAADARSARTTEEALCAYYVAMTRAMNAMTIVCQPPPKESEKRYMSSFVREAVEQPIGDPAWYMHIPGEAAGKPGAAGRGPVAVARAPREHVRRRLPSLALHSGMNAGELFAGVSARAAAKARGTDLHALYEAIEWIDPAAPGNDLERQIVANGWLDAFARGDDATALWREKKYELLVGDKWESGQFDRVVFRGSGERRRAVVYDFKTNAPRPRETREAFAQRMAAAYAGQMEAYRNAVVSLAKLAPGRVETVLLLSATGEALKVPPRTAREKMV